MPTVTNHPTPPSAYQPPLRADTSAWNVYTPANATALQNIFDGTTPITRPAVIKLDPANNYSRSTFVIRVAMGNPADGWVYVQPTDAALASLPDEGMRVEQSDISNMPHVVGLDTELSTLRILPGLGDLKLRFIGVDFTHADTTITRAMIDTVRADNDGLGTSSSDYPRYLIFEQCLIHGFAGNYLSRFQREGIAFHARDGALIDSQIYDFRAGTQEAKAVWIHQASKRILISNNFIFGVGSCLFVGGSDIKAIGELPEDLDFVGNELGSDDKFDPLHPSYVGVDYTSFVFKNKTECKSGLRIRWRGNIISGLYDVDGSQGQAFVFKASNQFGTDDWTETSDLICEYNHVTDVPSGFSLIPSADGNVTTQLGKRWRISNNFLHMDNRHDKVIINFGFGFAGNEGEGSALCGQDIEILHNTVVGRADQTDPTSNNSTIALMSAIENSYDRLDFKDNIGFNHAYIIFQNNGSPGGATGQGRLNYEFVTFDSENNLSIGDAGTGHLPTNWYQEADIANVQFVDPDNDNWELDDASPYAAGGFKQASDGKDMGVDWDELNAVLAPALAKNRFASAPPPEDVIPMHPVIFRLR